MKVFQNIVLLTVFVLISGSLFDINQVKNNILQWKNISFPNLSEIGALSNGIFDLGDVKNKILKWKTQLCPTNAVQLQNLLNVVCSTAQPTNTTSRDGCISCFSAVTSLPEGPRKLNGLSQCANQFFLNTPYAVCSAGLAILATSALNVEMATCLMAYCDFVKCVRRINSINLITQCSREARTGINLTVDADNVRFFINVTSCILAKSLCGTFNPITGDPQRPGFTAAGVRLSNALQITAAGDLRVMAFAASTPVSAAFCTTTATNLMQTSWLTNVC